MKIMLPLLTLIGCTTAYSVEEKPRTDTVPENLIMHCWNVDNWYFRCENSEIICYDYVRRDSHELKCKWKN